MSAALLRDANKQQSIADSLESVLHVLTWTTLCYVPHKMGSVPLNKHLKWVYDEYDTLTGTGGDAKGDKLAIRRYIPPELRLVQSSPLLDLLKTLADPFVAVYGENPGEVMKYTQMEDQKDTLKYLHAIYNARMACSESPEWFQEVIQMALDDSWPADDESSVQNCSAQFNSPNTRAVQAPTR